MWQHYREHTFKQLFTAAINEGLISEDDANAFQRFIGLANCPTFSLFVLIKSGQLTHLEGDEGYQATLRVLDALHLGEMEFSNKTSMPTEEQFWQQFDGFYQLTEDSLNEELPNFITDPNNRAKVEALLA